MTKQRALLLVHLLGAFLVARPAARNRRRLLRGSISLGVGGAVRFNKGTAPLMLPQRDPAMEVGRLTFATGLRFRF